MCRYWGSYTLLWCRTQKYDIIKHLWTEWSLQQYNSLYLLLLLTIFYWFKRSVVDRRLPWYVRVTWDHSHYWESKAAHISYLCNHSICRKGEKVALTNCEPDISLYCPYVVEKYSYTILFFVTLPDIKPKPCHSASLLHRHWPEWVVLSWWSLADWSATSVQPAVPWYTGHTSCPGIGSSQLHIASCTSPYL